MWSSDSLKMCSQPRRTFKERRHNRLTKAVASLQKFEKSCPNNGVVDVCLCGMQRAQPLNIQHKRDEREWEYVSSNDKADDQRGRKKE